MPDESVLTRIVSCVHATSAAAQVNPAPRGFEGGKERSEGQRSYSSESPSLQRRADCIQERGPEEESCPCATTRGKTSRTSPSCGQESCKEGHGRSESCTAAAETRYLSASEWADTTCTFYCLLHRCCCRASASANCAESYASRSSAAENAAATSGTAVVQTLWDFGIDRRNCIRRCTFHNSFCPCIPV